MTTLRLPLPPSVNSLYANVPGKGRVRTKRYLTWLNAAGWAIKQTKPKPKKIKGNYSLWLYCERPDRRRRDLGNMLKAIEDILVEHGIIADDSFAADIHCYWAGTGYECQVQIEAAVVERGTMRRMA